MKNHTAFFTLLLLLLCFAQSSIADERVVRMDSKLSRAISVALVEAKRCGVDLDEAELKVLIQGESYLLEFSQPGKRGGGAQVVVGRDTAQVGECRCLQ